MAEPLVGFSLTRTLSGMWEEVGILTDRALDRHLRIAVTGLRRSGKTVLITSLVHHLQDGQGLPFLQAVHDQRYLGARLLPLGPNSFPFTTFVAALQETPPRWPKATDRLASLRLEIAFRTSSLLLRQVQPIQHQSVEIIDYPGEWLLDLPLLEKRFDEFSADALALMNRPARMALAAPFNAAVAEADLDGPADPATARALANTYTRYLHRCQDELGFSLVQPGRFTNPGELEGSDILAFCPLPYGDFRPGTTRTLIATRFEHYREAVIRAFYEEHFSRFDRQIVLVDLLSSLNAGPEHFQDTQDSLALILESFRYGSGGILARLFAPRIDKVLFAVSKADHVAPNQHANLKQLLELMIAPAARSARFAGIATEVLALAAVRSTDTVRTEHHGQSLSCVRGRLKSEDRETVLFPGEIPPALPEPEDWRSGRFRFRDFAPRRLTAGAKGQHIRLDQALEFLLGDKLL